MNTLLKHINNGQPSHQESVDASWASFEACISTELKECWKGFKPGSLGITPEDVEEVREALLTEDQDVLSAQMISWLQDSKNRYTNDVIIETFCDNLL
jgi:hypothetical protein